MSKPSYAVIVCLQVDNRWLALSREERNRIAAPVFEIMEKHAPGVRCRYFDADAFNGSLSDFVLCETEDLQNHHFLWEELKDSPCFTEGYFTITNVIIGLEEGYRRYEASL